MPLLTNLPPEIVYHILGYVDPPDLAWIPRTCKTLYHAVSANTPLFKHVYLRHLDAPSGTPVDWERSLKQLVQLRRLCSRPDADDKKDELDFVHRTAIELLKNASAASGDSVEAGLTANFSPSRNADILTEIFSVESNQDAFLCRSFIYERARAEFHARDIRYWHGPPKPEHQKSAHLHCLYGVPLLFAYPSARRRTRHNLMHPFACSKVYDLRQYTEQNQWGPFLNDGSMRVDWEKVEAILIVLGDNMTNLGLSTIRMCKTFCTIPFAGTWANSWKSHHLSPPPPHELELQDRLDPYGITGVWLRIVCFMDYTDFFAYNFGSDEQPPPHVPRPSIDVGQATRLIIMRIFVTSIEKPGPEDGQELPVVHFKGVSRSLDQSFDENADSDLRGIVRLTPEGEVRWTTFSIFGGVERWRSESVQVGGVKSAKGVLGHWFDKDFDPRGPAGPTAFWKISDKEPSALNEAGEAELMTQVDVLDGDYETDENGDEDDVEDGEALPDAPSPLSEAREL
ncbi:hypothetical protein F5B22DRAFT_409150 [Xylaria bambusicola]|uniref:uncharacterized protein n=1 Tax=Xylaria bambusicola TaxID=326684 RepID=UPI0020082415|nr:uncharacterized protein F5B22DRAFT_409150 [Xylaria bambusicola]KAI0523685.1 hypothetical protein F5B22DRAFT_409150 [Xylaria bambusicola]